MILREIFWFCDIFWFSFWGRVSEDTYEGGRKWWGRPNLNGDSSHPVYVQRFSPYYVNQIFEFRRGAIGLHIFSKSFGLPQATTAFLQYFLDSIKKFWNWARRENSFASSTTTHQSRSIPLTWSIDRYSKRRCTVKILDRKSVSGTILQKPLRLLKDKARMMGSFLPKSDWRSPVVSSNRIFQFFCEAWIQNSLSVWDLTSPGSP